MEVAHFHDAESHVLMGGGVARAARISESAIAFRTMSDTLYQNKVEAVVRETVCNATDAHIAQGCPEVPVELGLTRNEFYIQDFGPGIPDEKMVDIYLTLFSTTKAFDPNMTGGFGLGSKAPFAVTDHFTITNCHEGFKRIYAATLGDETTNNMPAITQMVCVPCGEEHGLRVTIPIKEDQYNDFSETIERIVKNGGIKATLNGTPIQVQDFTDIRRVGYGLALAAYSRYNRMGKIKLLLGNVVYPLNAEAHPDLTFPISRLEESGLFEGFDVIVVAEPGTISVVPSREALSYNAMTVENLKKLLDIPLDKIRSYLPRSVNQLYGEYAKSFETVISLAEASSGSATLWFQANQPSRNMVSGPEFMALEIAKRQMLGNFHKESLVKAALKNFPRESRTLLRRFAHSNNRQKILKKQLRLWRVPKSQNMRIPQYVDDTDTQVFQSSPSLEQQFKDQAGGWTYFKNEKPRERNLFHEDFEPLRKRMPRGFGDRPVTYEEMRAPALARQREEEFRSKTILSGIGITPRTVESCAIIATRKRVMRMVDKLGLINKLYYVSEDGCFRINKNDPHRRKRDFDGHARPRGSTVSNLMITPSRGLIEYSGGYSLVLTDKEIAELDKTVIEELAKRFSIEVKYLEKPKPSQFELDEKARIAALKAKEVPKHPHYMSLDLSQMERGYNSSINDGRCIIPKFDMFDLDSVLINPEFFFETGKSSILHGTGFNITNRIKNKLPKFMSKDQLETIAVVGTKTSYERMIALGIKPIEEVILDRLAKRLKKPKPYEKVYAEASIYGTVYESTFGTPMLIGNMVFRSREGADVAMGLDYAKSSDRDESYNLWMTARILINETRAKGRSYYFNDDSKARIQGYLDRLLELEKKLLSPSEKKEILKFVDHEGSSKKREDKRKCFEHMQVFTNVFNLNLPDKPEDMKTVFEIIVGHRKSLAKKAAEKASAVVAPAEVEAVTTDATEGTADVI
jgi:hypothetical protein